MDHNRGLDPVGNAGLDPVFDRKTEGAIYLEANCQFQDEELVKFKYVGILNKG
jgi:hypothetical protein